MKQLFRMDKAAREASKENARNIALDLIKVNLFKSPFDEFAIEFPIEDDGSFIIGFNKASKIFKDVDQCFDCGVEYVAATKNGKIIIQESIKEFFEGYSKKKGFSEAREQLMNFYYELTLLIVLLATKNIVKEVKHNPLAKFGVGKGKAEYVTTLSIGKITETEREHADTGRELRPHLRRGHIRNQHYGPNNSFSKQVWIPSVFVNSDKEYLPPGRVAYNVSLPKELKLTGEELK